MMEDGIDWADMVVNCMPYQMNDAVIEMIRRKPVDYFDLSEDVFYTKKHDWSDYPKAFVPHCGIAPGLINMMAARQIEQFDEVIDVKMRVGALPRLTTNMFKYHCTWSPDGLINQYVNPVTVLDEGVKKELNPLSLYEVFTLDGVQYEAACTSGGIGTMADTYEGGVERMTYKSIRYPGHYAAVKPYLSEDFRREHLKTSLSGWEGEDHVIAWAQTQGIKNGKARIQTTIRDWRPSDDWSAIQLATTDGLIAAIEALYNARYGGQSVNGWIKQEQLA
jgi:saccharopine dehydrogenase-like NADP-dependent oxidoreductase